MVPSSSITDAPSPWRPSEDPFVHKCLADSRLWKNPTSIKDLEVDGISDEELNVVSFLPKETSRGHYVSLVTTISLASGRCLEHSRH